ASPLLMTIGSASSFITASMTRKRIANPERVQPIQYRMSFSCQCNFRRNLGEREALGLVQERQLDIRVGDLARRYSNPASQRARQMSVIVVATLPDRIGDRNAFSEQVHREACALDLAHDVERHADYAEEAALRRAGGERSWLVLQCCGDFRISFEKILAHKLFDELFRILEAGHLPLPAVENELTPGGLRQRDAHIVQQLARRKLRHERSGLESNREPFAVSRASQFARVRLGAAYRE